MTTIGEIDRTSKLTNCKKILRNFKVISTKSFLFSCNKSRKMLAQKRRTRLHKPEISVDNIIIHYNHTT